MSYQGMMERHKIPPCDEMINTNYFKKNSSGIYAELEGNPHKSFLVMSRTTPVAVILSPDEYTRLVKAATFTEGGPDSTEIVDKEDGFILIGDFKRGKLEQAV